MSSFLSTIQKTVSSAKDNISFILVSLVMVVVVYFIAFGCEKIIEKKNGIKFSSEKTKINKLVIMAMFSAVAAVLMYVEFPITFIAPSFYEMDLSEVPVMIGSFMLGPCAGVIMEAVKVLLKLVLKGTSTAFVGDFANFILGCALVVPASVVYHTKKTKKRAIIGLVTGGIVLIVSGVFLNALYLLPKYSQLYGMPVETFIKMGAAINPAISNIFTFVILAVAPFNLIKATVVGVITMLLYKYLSRLIKVHNN
ncbi:MAG: ECF transporter S component [Lachnospira sp.]|nr:ECF transporter S component [Clostridia bacterium]